MVQGPEELREGKVQAVAAAGADLTMPQISEVGGKIRGCMLQRCPFACVVLSLLLKSLSRGPPKPETSRRGNSGECDSAKLKHYKAK